MSSRKLLAAGAAAAIALGVMSAIAIAVSSGPARPPPSATPAAPQPGPAPVAAGQAIPAANAIRLEPAPADGPGAPVTPWEAVPVSARSARLGPIGATVTGGLRAARARMERCFRELQPTAAVGPEGDPVPGPASAPVLILHLEEREGAVDVVDATVQRGGDDPALVACCLEELRGFSFPAPPARAGRRHRLRFVLR